MLCLCVGGCAVRFRLHGVKFFRDLGGLCESGRWVHTNKETTKVNEEG